MEPSDVSPFIVIAIAIAFWLACFYVIAVRGREDKARTRDRARKQARQHKRRQRYGQLPQVIFDSGPRPTYHDAFRAWQLNE